MGKIWFFAGFVAVLTLGATGCGGAADAQKKRVRELEEELTRLQNSHDRLEERVTSLEVSGQQVPAEAEPSTRAEPAQKEQPTATLERPPLKVFKLSPPSANGAPQQQPEPATEDPSSDEDSEGEPRPVIRGRGQHVEKARGSSGAARPKAPGSKLSQNNRGPATGTQQALP